MSLWCCCVLLRNWAWPHRQPLAANLACLLFVVFYPVLGGYVFLHFERSFADESQRAVLEEKRNCVHAVIHGDSIANETELAHLITQYCFMDLNYDSRTAWNLRNSMLFGFGVITTLGYGLLEPATTNGRIFTVMYGILGIPITVIMFSNFGRYLQNLELYLRHRFCPRRTKGNRRPSQLTRRDEIEQVDQISAPLLMVIVILYMAIGALFIPLMNGKLDFLNGIYYAFLCITALEFGELIPRENEHYVPLVIIYIVLGLVISTIALDIGSTYVRKLYYVGRRIPQISNVKIWFGSKDLRVKELIAAVGQNIGLDPAIFSELNLDQLVSDAIDVKEGKLERVPQTHVIIDGIWPPELVPLFLKDGHFPNFVDEDETDSSMLRAKRRMREYQSAAGIPATITLCRNVSSPSIIPAGRRTSGTAAARSRVSLGSIRSFRRPTETPVFVRLEDPNMFFLNVDTAAPASVKKPFLEWLPIPEMDEFPQLEPLKIRANGSNGTLLP